MSQIDGLSAVIDRRYSGISGIVVPIETTMKPLERLVLQDFL